MEISTPENLQGQIDRGRRDIYTTKMTMSIGELANMYRDGELELQPEFQRMFRWSTFQKSRLIESLLLGIPVPSIFVHQRQDGVWDVIDGVQRLSTILEFMGFLDPVEYPPSQLLGTDYLPALENCFWDDKFGSPALSLDQQRLIKRAIIDVSIVSRESDVATKFELFERLNAGGSLLSVQEIRNALLVLANREFFQWIVSLSEDENFVSSISLSERNLEERYDLELVLRFLIFTDISETKLREIRDLSDFITKESMVLAKNFEAERESLQYRFIETFKIIDSVFVEQEAFKRFSTEKGKHSGGFLVSAFERVTVGVASNLENLKSLEENERTQFLASRVREMWADAAFARNSGAGVRANTRIQYSVPASVEFFRP